MSDEEGPRPKHRRVTRVQPESSRSASSEVRGGQVDKDARIRALEQELVTTRLVSDTRISELEDELKTRTDELQRSEVINRRYKDIAEKNMDAAILALKQQKEAARVLRLYKFASSDSHTRTHMYSQHMHGAAGRGARAPVPSPRE